MSTIRSRLSALKSRGRGALDAGVLSPRQSVEAVWRHIVEGLDALAMNGKTDQMELNENALTQRLFDELQGRAEGFPFYFDKEYMEDEGDGNSRRIDIAVKPRKARPFVVRGVPYAFPKAFLALEAKRLPAPKKGREREYLAGERGGVERFKRGHHAQQLTEVGLIGYVQRYSFDYWRVRINQWVDELLAASQADLPWDAQDRLELEAKSQRLAQLRSTSLRVSDQQRLTIRHLWVQLAIDGVA